ncbi:hypothetical protein [Limnoglobus roseus]|uniref:Uncharacterized protein n=1 Tax=Limnoglobus roseus TaxID=2598579 RepID=A0A5C1AKY2_9BACT|nr:hypothetical protein [Limnoglobus roseus]QEL18382.1 hypothetical protein PX52LOC_05405 [Limnoglobus roseus]
MPKQKSFGQRVLANLKKKVVQLLLATALLGGIVWGSARLLGPKTLDRVDTAGQARAKEEYKYLICNSCKLEVLYTAELDNHTCPKCQPPKVGYLMPSKTSIKSGGDGNPWRRYNVAVAIEAVLYLALIYYLLSRPVDETPTEFVLTCLHCGLSLQYKPDGFDQYAICPGCEQVIKLPDEDEAMTREDQEHVREMTILTAMELDLRKSGTIVDADAENGEPNPHDAPRG